MESFYNKYKGKSVNLDIDSDTFVECEGEIVGCISIHKYSDIGPGYLADISTSLPDIYIRIRYIEHYYIEILNDSGGVSIRFPYTRSLENFLNTGDEPFEDKLKAIIREMHDRFNTLTNKPF